MKLLGIGTTLIIDDLYKIIKIEKKGVTIRNTKTSTEVVIPLEEMEKYF